MSQSPIPPQPASEAQNAHPQVSGSEQNAQQAPVQQVQPQPVQQPVQPQTTQQLAPRQVPPVYYQQPTPQRPQLSEEERAAKLRSVRAMTWGTLACMFAATWAMTLPGTLWLVVAFLFSAATIGLGVTVMVRCASFRGPVLTYIIVGMAMFLSLGTLMMSLTALLLPSVNDARSCAENALTVSELQQCQDNAVSGVSGR